MTSEIVAALLPLSDAFRVLGIQYRVGGSVASSVFGVMRATYDIDLVANVEPKHVDPLVAMLSTDYYIDAELIRHEIEHSSSFNLIYLDSMMKVDVFILGQDEYDQEAFGRAIQLPLSADDATDFTLCTPEDIVLRKLDWHRRGGGASERQLEDVVQVLRVRSDTLDRTYLDLWASKLDVSDELVRCWRRANESG